MVILRILGWSLVAAALFLVGREALTWRETGDWAVIPTGQVWFELHRESLLLLQPAIERYIWPALWDPGITTILQWPAWVAVGGLGLLLLLVGWILPGRHRRRRA